MYLTVGSCSELYLIEEDTFDRIFKNSSFYEKLKEKLYKYLYEKAQEPFYLIRKKDFEDILDSLKVKED